MNTLRLPSLVTSTLLATLVSLASAPAQHTALPVDDLLATPVQRGAYLGMLHGYSLRAARLIQGEADLGGFALEEDEWWFHDAGQRGHFTAEQLQAVLQALGLQEDVVVLGHHVLVPEKRVPVARQLLEDLRDALPPRLSISVRLLQRTAKGERVRIQRTIECDPGRLHVISEVQRRDAVVEYDVEIAEASSIANPIVREFRTGAMVAIRPQLSPSGESGALEVIARCTTLLDTPPIDPGHPGFGPIDRVPLTVSEIGRVVHVRPGARTEHRWSDEQGAFELVLETQWQLPKPSRPGGHVFGAFTMRGTLTGFRSVAAPADDSPFWSTEETDEEDPWVNIRQIAGPEAGWLYVTDEPATETQPFVALDQRYWAAGAVVTPWFEAMRPSTECSVRCYSLPNGETWPEDGEVPANAVNLGHADLVQVDGTWSATAIRREASILRDWEVEVASSARIPDPSVERLSTGLVLNARCRGGAIELEGELSRVLEDGHKTLTLSAPIFAPVVGHGSDAKPGNVQSPMQSERPKLAQVSDVVNVQHPVTATLPLHFTRKVEAGKSTVWRTPAHAVLGEGRDLVIVLAGYRTR